MIYTGIGSRQTPHNIISLMEDIGELLSIKTWTLRSGGAKGADIAFETGCLRTDSVCEIYLPWKQFNQHQSNLFNVSEEAMYLASKFHPRWNNLPDWGRKLHGRSAYQVLGIDLNSPSDVLICWTYDGCESDSRRNMYTGGTGTAISIADYYNIPIINLKNNNAIKRVEDILSAKRLLIF